MPFALTTNITVKNVNFRMERHGDEDVLYADLKFDSEVSIDPVLVLLAPFLNAEAFKSVFWLDSGRVHADLLKLFVIDLKKAPIQDQFNMKLCYSFLDEMAERTFMERGSVKLKAPTIQFLNQHEVILSGTLQFRVGDDPGLAAHIKKDLYLILEDPDYRDRAVYLSGSTEDEGEEDGDNDGGVEDDLPWGSSEEGSENASPGAGDEVDDVEDVEDNIPV